ncbi:hypothetical protein CLV58_10615 [Spirosoma oryzae]|uniref:Uncharacterized protein n=1 Tax=Spirosoma oryzae TaxID=1469603 RepID=A0A2T0T592_9BACT|nr:hypothetical protein [Spirosoma oryzae]PRY40832.1 hypothetical protein CLV58_10615 [Spirosoma oryzae]
MNQFICVTHANEESEGPVYINPGQVVYFRASVEYPGGSVIRTTSNQLFVVKENPELIQTLISGMKRSESSEKTTPF